MAMVNEVIGKVMELWGLEETPTLRFGAERCMEMVKGEIGASQVPEGLLHVCVEMTMLLCQQVEKFYEMDRIHQIKEGEVSITFGEEKDIVMEAMRTRWAKEFDKYRKLGW